jgi:hypothetical protein
MSCSGSGQTVYRRQGQQTPRACLVTGSLKGRVTNVYTEPSASFHVIGDDGWTYNVYPPRRGQFDKPPKQGKKLNLRKRPWNTCRVACYNSTTYVTQVIPEQDL